MSRIWLARADEQDVRSLFSWVLWSLIRFSACPRAVVALVEPLWRRARERSDDSSDIETEACRFNAGDDAPFHAVPALGGVGRLAMGSMGGEVLLDPHGSAGVGGGCDDGISSRPKGPEAAYLGSAKHITVPS